jgi:hypothetical protein
VHLSKPNRQSNAAAVDIECTPHTRVRTIHLRLQRFVSITLLCLRAGRFLWRNDIKISNVVYAYLASLSASLPDLLAAHPDLQANPSLSQADQQLRHCWNELQLRGVLILCSTVESYQNRPKNLSIPRFAKRENSICNLKHRRKQYKRT